MRNKPRVAGTWKIRWPASRIPTLAAAFEDVDRAGRDSHVMSANLAPVLRPSTDRALEDEQLSPPELATARYVDREINDARATAKLCKDAGRRARAQGKTLIAGILSEFEGEFTGEAAFLQPASVPDVHWPPRALWEVDDDAELDEWIDTIHASLQHSVRTLRWIARRPDLSPLAKVTFDALASAHQARRRLLLACIAIDR